MRCRNAPALSRTELISHYFTVMFSRFALLLLITFCSEIDSICKFVYEGGKDTPNNSSIAAGSLPGLITISGRFNLSATVNIGQEPYISFDSAPDSSPMILTFPNSSTLSVGGRENGSLTTPQFSIQDAFTGDTFLIQVSDISAAEDGFYSIFTNTSGTRNKCDLGSGEIWRAMFESSGALQLQNATGLRINSSDLFTLDYISICKDPTTSVTDLLAMNPVLGDELRINCLGAGAPFLEARWLGLHGEANNQSTVHISSGPTHEISSILTIQNFTFGMIGNEIECVVLNSNNLSDPSVATTKLIYAEPYNISFHSNDTYLPDTILDLMWTVSGWPLDILHLECSNQTNSTSTISTTEPYGWFRATLNTSTFDGPHITCLFSTNSLPQAEFRIWRVGWDCSEGQMGVGRSCVDCAHGETSEPRSDHCFRGNSTCEAGQFGIGSSCSSCPWGMVSDEGAVKLKDCYLVNSSCAAGYFGYKQMPTVCKLCPFGSRSSSGCVKVLDCETVSSKCSKNHYLDKNNTCADCPGRLVAALGAAKPEDCFQGNTSCGENMFWMEDGCTWCPHGSLSAAGTVKVEDCIPIASACGEGTYGVEECRECEWGQSTCPGAAKEQDCRAAASTCPANYYLGPCGLDPPKCAPCPPGTTVREGAGKLLDCLLHCPADSYRDGKKCVQCPKKTHCPAGSETKKDCTKSGLKPQAVFLISVCAVLAFIFAILLGTFIRFRVHARRKQKAFQMVFTGNSDRSFMIENPVCDD